MPSHGQTKDVVVLIHGFAGHRLIMWPLARRLRRAGFRPINWGYRSLRGSIAGHASRFLELLTQLEDDPSVVRFHIVAHSMGGIVTREALRETRPSKLGRIVMLGPPNHGSFAANYYAFFLGWLIPTLREIKETPNSFVNLLPENLGAKCEVGILAPRRDLVVRRESTYLQDMKEHVVVPGMHTSMLWHSETARRVVSFLKTGSFSPLATRPVD